MVLSMLMLEAAAGALTLPALSVHVPEADCAAPSLLKTTGAEQESRPDKLSEPVKLTVTSVLLQPLAFGPGAALALAVGTLLSTLISEIEAGALSLPALSVQVPEAD